MAAQASEPATKSSLVLAAKACASACRSSEQECEQELRTLRGGLVQLAGDDALEPGARAQVILQLSADSGAEVEALLLQLLEGADVDAAAAAAISLMRSHFDEHGGRIAARLEAWRDHLSSTAAMARRVYDRRRAERSGG